MKSKRLSLIVVLLLALFAGLSWAANRHVGGLRHPNYTTFSNSDYGLSLLFDTLRHMGYPVAVLYRPASEAGINDAVFIANPRLTSDMTGDILAWVRRGGRLIYLDNRHTNNIDHALDGENYTNFGSLRWYRHGMGEILTGRAGEFTNVHLMEDPFYGEGIAYMLYVWNPEYIYFADYYHGFRRTDSAFRQLPLWLQLIFFQIVIGTAALMWHWGKRFGNPVPLYEEMEREENEQVFVLARLYKQADKRR